jgi:hypothetical protein
MVNSRWDVAVGAAQLTYASAAAPVGGAGFAFFGACWFGSSIDVGGEGLGGWGGCVEVG